MSHVNQIRQAMRARIREVAPRHPFSKGILPENLRPILRKYMAMSQAFPYLQSVAAGTVILDVMARNGDVDPASEVTGAVAAFLVADETGVIGVLREEGMKGLPSILETRSRYHSNLLRDDAAKVLGSTITPDYDPSTRRYLEQLLARLSDADAVARCATMVAFEAHAARMISALWASVARTWQGEKDELAYFRTHVGGSDPAEAYHVEMTNRMIDVLVPAERTEEFLAAFEAAYALNIDWCATIISESIEHNRAA